MRGVNPRLAELVAAQLRTLRALLLELRALEQRYQAELSQLEELAGRLEAWGGDPPVLVRRTRRGRGKVYHQALRPCGWVRRRPNFQELLEGEALARGLRRCSACSWPGSWRPVDPRP